MASAMAPLPDPFQDPPTRTIGDLLDAAPGHIRIGTLTELGKTGVFDSAAPDSTFTFSTDEINTVPWTNLRGIAINGRYELYEIRLLSQPSKPLYRVAVDYTLDDQENIIQFFDHNGNEMYEPMTASDVISIEPKQPPA